MDQWTERKNASEFWLMRRILTMVAMWLGACSLVSLAGYAVVPHALTRMPGQPAMVLIAIALAVWLWRAPSPSGFLALCGAFVVGIACFLFSMPQRSGGDRLFFLIWGVALTVMACGYLYLRYRRFAPLANVETRRELIEEVGALIKQTMAGKQSPDASVFVIRVSQRRAYKIGLFADELLLVDDIGWDLCLARREDVQFQDRHRVLLGTDHRVTIQIGNRKWKGRMSAGQSERLQNWLEQPTAS